jgi:hypothetical protein
MSWVLRFLLKFEGVVIIQDVISFIFTWEKHYDSRILAMGTGNTMV